jgi:ubiquitin C-terminal hydrolase
VDEISVSQIDTRRVHVACPSDFFAHSSPACISHASTSVCISTGSNGESYRTVVLVPYKNVPIEFEKAQTSKLLFIPSHKGWQSKATFEFIFATILLEDIKKQRLLNGDENKPVLVLVDPTSTHVTPTVCGAALASNIDIMCIPSHLSHICQPNDRGVNANIKNPLSLFRSWEHETSNSTHRITFINSLKNALDVGLSRKSILHAWKESGLFPFNFLHIIKKLPIFTPHHSFPRTKGIQRMENCQMGGEVIVRCDTSYSFKNLHLEYWKLQNHNFVGDEIQRTEKEISSVKNLLNNSNINVQKLNEAKLEVLNVKLKFIKENEQLIYSSPLRAVKSVLNTDSISFLKKEMLFKPPKQKSKYVFKVTKVSRREKDKSMIDKQSTSPPNNNDTHHTTPLTTHVNHLSSIDNNDTPQLHHKFKKTLLNSKSFFSAFLKGSENSNFKSGFSRFLHIDSQILCTFIQRISGEVVSERYSKHSSSLLKIPYYSEEPNIPLFLSNIITGIETKISALSCNSELNIPMESQGILLRNILQILGYCFSDHPFSFQQEIFQAEKSSREILDRYLEINIISTPELSPELTKSIANKIIQSDKCYEQGKDYIPVIGLRNIGNSCFINSIIQAFHSLLDSNLVAELLKSEEEGSPSFCFFSIIKDLINGNNADPVQLSSFVESVRDFFGNSLQQDELEMIYCLMGMFGSSNSLSNLCLISLQTHTECLGCGFLSSSESVDDFCVPLHTASVSLGLSQLINGVISLRETDCSSCHVKGFQRIIIEIKHFPFILIISLQNFLQLSHSFSSVDLQGESYDLKAIIIYEKWGNNLSNEKTTSVSGHYSCAFIHSDWVFLANDERVSNTMATSLEKFILSEQSEEAVPYILFYIRRDMDNANEKYSNVDCNSPDLHSDKNYDEMSRNTPLTPNQIVTITPSLLHSTTNDSPEKSSQVSDMVKRRNSTSEQKSQALKFEPVNKSDEHYQIHQSTRVRKKKIYTDYICGNDCCKRKKVIHNISIDEDNPTDSQEEINILKKKRKRTGHISSMENSNETAPEKENNRKRKK